MAEYLLRPSLPEGWETGSAGLYAAMDAGASQEAINVLAQRNIDLSPHRSRPLTREHVDAACIVVVMTHAHREQFRARYPEAEDKVYLLTTFDPQAGGSDVADPIGSTRAVYEETCSWLEAAMNGLLRYIETFKSERDRL
jgi:protein-tyrosine-phosphatase